MITSYISDAYDQLASALHEEIDLMLNLFLAYCEGDDDYTLFLEELSNVHDKSKVFKKFITHYNVHEL